MIHQHQSLMVSDAGYDAKRFGKTGARSLRRGRADRAKQRVHAYEHPVAGRGRGGVRAAAWRWSGIPEISCIYAISQTDAVPFRACTGAHLDRARNRHRQGLGLRRPRHHRLSGQPRMGRIPALRSDPRNVHAGGARAMGFESQVGSIEVGKRADIVIRSNDLPDAQPNVNVVKQPMLCQPHQGRRHGAVQWRDRCAPRPAGEARRGGNLPAGAAVGRTNRAERAGIKPKSNWPVVTLKAGAPRAPRRNVDR